ncbi:matrixin family metalloprotease [Telmatocola sphagniphila]|uniref:Matrixin family metalloprotease n=1 Tax=Telmatocola sphagniphila TaxID=1123043 RepID=A0A8E6ESD4_9BACT|nr:matrixin family metalloprotease [Telmatocola sphagniphila]QVL30559.1 matrixin family metalloprotease [Telmatocola sphagniphila]
MKTHHKLKLETFEERIVPATFGIPWQGRNITVSFAPDGTNIQGNQSNLFAAMTADGLTQAQWQGQILKALESWVAVSNINLGVVADNGAAEGSPGFIQGDPNFGDVRIFGEAFNSNQLALTAPPGYTSETGAGDVILNTNYKFGVGGTNGAYDLFSTVIHESGHALGIDDNTTDPNSVMYYTYQGIRTGLDETDIASIQSLYGAANSSSSAGTKLSTATAIPAVTGSSNLFTNASLTASGQTEYYKFTVPSTQTGSTTLTLSTETISLLQGSFKVLDSSGNVLATSGETQSDTTFNGANASVTLFLTAGKTYYVEVFSTDPVFNVGAYTLSTVFNASSATAPASAPYGFLAQTPTSTTTSNSSLSNAQTIPSYSGATGQLSYQTFAVLQNLSTPSYYKVTAPTLASGSTTTLTIVVAAYNSSRGSSTTDPVATFAPNVTVYNSNGTALSLQSIASEGFHNVYQILNVTRGQQFYIQVKGNILSFASNYLLTAVFQPVAVQQLQALSTTLTSAAPSSTGVLTINEGQILSLELSLTSASGAPLSGATVTITNASGNTISTWFVLQGTSFSNTLFLTPGSYTVSITGFNVFGNVPNLGVIMDLVTLTDPIDIAPSSPLGTAPTHTSSTGSTTTHTSTTSVTYTTTK